MRKIIIIFLVIFAYVDVNLCSLAFCQLTRSPIKIKKEQTAKLISDSDEATDSPVIISFNINTFHDKNNYRIDAWAVVQNPQGQNDIVQVKAIDAEKNEFILKVLEADFYYEGGLYGLTPPPLGETRIVAIDKSANSDTVSENLMNVVEELPIILFPTHEDLLSETNPLIDWNDVHDEHSSITYDVELYRLDNDKEVWTSRNLNESEVQFNVDGTAVESLQEKTDYYIVVFAKDTLGNGSYDRVIFTFGNTISLENDYLRIDFHPIHPLAIKYIFKTNNEIIYGDLVNEMFLAKIFYHSVSYDIIPSVSYISQEENRITYHMVCKIGENIAITFDLSYVLAGNSIQVIFNNVTENEGYKLVLVQSPDLLTIRGSQPKAKLIFPQYEGRLINIKSANPGYEDIQSGGWYRPLLASMLYHENLAAVVSYDHLDMMLWTRIFDHSKEGRLATIGITFNYRYQPTNFSTATFIDVFDSITNSLSVEIYFVEDYDNDNDTDWMDGAKLLRDQVQATPHPEYLSCFISKISNQGKGIIKLSDHLKTIQKLNHLTDHNKIISYFNEYRVPEFQIFGEEDDFIPEWSLEEFIELVRVAEEEYNCCLSLHDVYTDYYPGTPGYNPDLRAIQADGNPRPGWPLPGYPEAYVADPYDYAINAGLERVRKTLNRYPIKKSYHIDVLSLAFIKDYSLNSPASLEKNRRGVQLIIDEFKKADINVTSEGLTGQFVESGMGWFLEAPRFFESTSFGNEKIIPLIEFIYHGKTLYGLHESFYENVFPPEQQAKYTFLDPLLLGGNSAAHITWHSPNNLKIDKFYLIDLPWMALNERFMEDYEEQGSYRKITYDENTYVEIDYEANSYTVQVDGRIIGKDYTTIYPKSDSTFLVYSRDAKAITIEVPDQWQKNMILQKLTRTGPEGNIPFAMVNNTVIFNTESETPYKLIRISGVPTSPVLLLPQNNDTIPSTNIEFKWEIPSNSNFCQLQISSESIFSSIVFASDSIYVSSYEVKGLTNHKDYYWRVKAFNKIGESEWSTVYAFKTDADAYPKAVRFLSDGDYIDVPHSSSLIPEHMTIEFWLRVLEVGDPSVGGGQTIIDKRGDGGGYNLNLYGLSFPLGILITFEPNGYTLGPGNVIESQKWYHIAVGSVK